MNLDIRYMVANARIAALADVRNWTSEDLQDVFALTSPSVPFEEWTKRVQGSAPSATPAPVAPIAPTPEDPDPETTKTMRMLLGPEGKRLQDLGIITVKEVPAA